jgi:hypothetical protein
LINTFRLACPDWVIASLITRRISASLLSSAIYRWPQNERQNYFYLIVNNIFFFDYDRVSSSSSPAMFVLTPLPLMGHFPPPLLSSTKLSAYTSFGKKTPDCGYYCVIPAAAAVILNVHLWAY